MTESGISESPGDDSDMEKVESDVIAVKKVRGEGLNWDYVSKFLSWKIALSAYSDDNLKQKELSKGRMARTKTLTK